MTRIAIVAARRSAQGRFLGGLAKASAVDLAVGVGRAIFDQLPRAELAAAVDQVIVGNVLSAGLGMNIARQIAIGLKLPIASTAFTVNMMCASAMKAIMLGCDAIALGQAQLVLCGGTESMSQAPYLLPRARMGLKLGDATLVDAILRDGLVDAFDHQHMGLSAERLATEFQLSRASQDAYAVQSQQRYAAARAGGLFNAELVPLAGLAADEHPRPETTRESLAKLAPAFDAKGTITAGNASGINDGAALVLVCSETFAAQQGLQPLAFIEGYTVTGCEPSRMGLGPVHATQQLLERTRCRLTDFDTIEINEAFAAQTLACMHSLSLDDSRVNRDGGAIALGHPIGASGARLIVHLAHRLAADRSVRGLATLCVGGGMGAAMSLVSSRGVSS